MNRRMYILIAITALGLTFSQPVYAGISGQNEPLPQYHWADYDHDGKWDADSNRNGITGEAGDEGPYEDPEFSEGAEDRAGDPNCLDKEDPDSDGVLNCDDNCIYIPNEDQADSDGDGFGDLCPGNRMLKPEGADDGSAAAEDESPDEDLGSPELQVDPNKIMYGADNEGCSLLHGVGPRASCPAVLLVIATLGFIIRRRRVS